MMRNIAISLAAATIAIGGSTLSVSALYGQESGISKGSMSGSAELTPLQRERIRGMVRERYAELTPLQRERLRGRCANGSPSSPRSNASVSEGWCANATPSSPRSNASVSEGRCTNGSPSSPRSNASVSSGSLAPATSSSLRSNASVSIVTALRPSLSGNRHGRLDVGRRLALLPLHRRAFLYSVNRVGAALLQQALLTVQLRQGRPAALSVSSKNSRAISLYKRLGFKTYREMRRFCAMRSAWLLRWLVMRRTHSDHVS